MIGKFISFFEIINVCCLWLNLDFICFNIIFWFLSGVLMLFCFLMFYYVMMQLVVEYVKDNDLDVLGFVEFVKVIKDYE